MSLFTRSCRTAAGRVLPGIALGIAIATSAVAQTQSGKPPTLDRNRDYFSQLPVERIDTFTGQVVLAFTDLVLPGNASRELRLQHSYSSDLPQLWTFGIAGVPMWVSDPPFTSNTHAFDTFELAKSNTPIFLMADGTRKQGVFMTKPRSDDWSTQQWVTTGDFWRYYRPLPGTPGDRPVLYLNDGSTCHFDAVGRVSFPDRLTAESRLLRFRSGHAEVEIQ